MLDAGEISLRRASCVRERRLRLRAAIFSRWRAGGTRSLVGGRSPDVDAGEDQNAAEHRVNGAQRITRVASPPLTISWSPSTVKSGREGFRDATSEDLRAVFLKLRPPDGQLFRHCRCGATVAGRQARGLGKHSDRAEGVIVRGGR